MKERSKKNEKAIAGCIAIWSCASWASGAVINDDTAIIINNESGAYIHGAFQSQIMSGIAVDSVNPGIHPDQGFTYDETDGFFNSSAVQIKAGDTIKQVGLFDTSTQSFVICDTDVVFEDRNSYAYDGEECTAVSEGTTLEMLFQLPGYAVEVSETHVAGNLGAGSSSSAFRMSLNSSGSYEDLYNQTGTISSAYSVNNQGDMVVIDCTDEVQHKVCLPALWTVNGDLIQLTDLHEVIEPTVTEGHFISYRPFVITDNQTIYGSVRFIAMPSAPEPKDEEVAWEWNPATGVRILTDLEGDTLDIRGSNARGGDGSNYIVGQSFSTRDDQTGMVPVYWENGADKPTRIIDITGGWLISRGISNQNADVLINLKGQNAIFSPKDKTVKELDNSQLLDAFPASINEKGEVLGYSEHSNHAIIFWDQNQKGHIVDQAAFEGRTPHGTMSLNNNGIISVRTLPDFPSTLNAHDAVYQIKR